MPAHLQQLRCLGFVITDSEEDVSGAVSAAFQRLDRLISGLSVLRFRHGSFWVLAYARGSAWCRKHDETEDVEIIALHRMRGSTMSSGSVRVTIAGQHLVVTGDWAGSMSLFYAYSGGRIVLSTNERLLHAVTSPDIGDIDRVSLFHLALVGHHVGKYTLFNGEFLLRGGESLSYHATERGGPEVRRSCELDAVNRRRIGMAEAAGEFHAVNLEIFADAFKLCEEVVLPLSSGYDSRLLACYLRAIDKPMRAVSYGDEDEIDVIGARRIARALGIEWQRVDIPPEHLQPSSRVIGEVFGCSMHLHGMYQLPVISHIRSQVDECAVTSGFMTGIPCGQHLRKNLVGPDSFDYLGAVIRGFEHLWTVRELFDLFKFDCRSAYTAASERWREEFEYDRFDDSQCSIIGDCRNRQARWISFFPRLYSHFMDCISPHMDVRYTRFMLSLPDKLLVRRALVEYVFSHYFRSVAGVISTSEGIRPPGRSVRHSAAVRCKWLRAHWPEYRAKVTPFYGRACKTCGARVFDGLLGSTGEFNPLMDEYLDTRIVEETARRALKGSQHAYMKLTMLLPIYFMLRDDIYSREC